jgi:hypothetical protein
VAAAVNYAAEKPVAVGAIEQEYSALWASLEHEEPELPLGRAMTANLILVGEAAQQDELRFAVERVLLRHPCRAFLVLLERDTHPLAAQLALATRSYGAERIVVLELLTLRCDGGRFARLPGLLRPLLEQDLPSHLFWARALPENGRDLATMARLADSVTVDSSLFAHPRSDRARLQAIGGPPAQDLAWYRLRPWRRALAEAFEHLDWQPGVATSTAITHGPTSGAVAAAHALGDWLARRLHADVRYETAGADAPQLQPEELTVLHGHAQVRVHHQLTMPRLQVEVTLADRCLLPFCTPASVAPVGDLLAAALDA